MNLKIGDKVVVIDDVIKGEVLSVENDSIKILSTEGFELIYSEDDLVKIDKEQSEIAKSVVVSMNLANKQEETKKQKKPLFKTQKDDGGVMEVDLHIQKLTKSTRGMDNFDMLNLQIETAKHKLEYAIRNRIPKVIFIHGVGAGVLKTELNFLLKRYNVNFYDASYQKYGMGATEVYIYQNKK